MAAKAKDFPYRVQVLDQALGILDLSSSQTPQLAPNELSGQLIILHKSTLVDATGNRFCPKWDRL